MQPRSEERGEGRLICCYQLQARASMQPRSEERGEELDTQSKSSAESSFNAAAF